MADIQPKAILNEMREDAKRGPLAKPLLIARVIAITAAVAGAIPTAITVYHSWVHGIPYAEVSHRLSQYDMWVKNFDCKIDYRALNTGQGTRIDAGACPKSGDIAIKITTASGKAAYEWIALDQLQKSSVASAILEFIVPTAAAEDAPRSVGAGLTRLAQTGGGQQVICQSMPRKAQIVRVVQDSGKCYRETFSPFLGKVEKREEVPCTTPCPPSGRG